jgi:hypothetical protein
MNSLPGNKMGLPVFSIDMTALTGQCTKPNRVQYNRQSFVKTESELRAGHAI